MRLLHRFATVGVLTSAAASLAFGGTALAAFPNFENCPRDVEGVQQCLDIQSTSGALTVKGVEIPLGDGLEIRGGLKADGTVVAPTGSASPLSSRAFEVPGGLLDAPIEHPYNRLTISVSAVGPVTFDNGTLGVSIPAKLTVSNPLIGSCSIGSDAAPIALALTTGTTAPPAPNTPITGAIGELQFLPDWLQFTGNKLVDNAFGLPGASGCQPAIRALLNSRLRLPSAAGRNALVVNADEALTYS